MAHFPTNYDATNREDASRQITEETCHRYRRAREFRTFCRCWSWRENSTGV